VDTLALPQNLYDSFTESSAAIEQEYEAELNKVEPVTSAFVVA
jgi:hypothetical protein